MAEQVELADLLSQYMNEFDIGAQNLAKYGNNILRKLNLSLDRSHINHWLQGEARTIRDWRRVAAIANVLSLDEERANRLFKAAGHLSIEELRANAKKEELYLLSPWAEVVRKPPEETPLAPVSVPLQRPPRAEHFIGREAELKQLLADLQPSRVVTLCGPGGIGKTALAIEAVWTLAPGDEPPVRFPDGVIYYSFYGQPQVDLAFEHIIRSFNEKLGQGLRRDAAQQALAQRQALLLLDGTENIDNLDALLDIRSRCGVLITSRKREDAGGMLLHLAPLPFEKPDDKAVTLLQAWGGVQAVDKATVQQICELVGGLPLAIRIAGKYIFSAKQDATEYLAWLKEMPLRALHRSEHQHKSIPILLEKSLKQVSEGARQVMTTVGVLALASFDRKVVSAALAVPEVKAGEMLGELVNYSLLDRSERRYTVSHPLVHTYARRRLIPPPAVIEQLAAYYISLAQEQTVLGLEGYVRLDAERSHLIAVLRECIELKEWEAAQNLAWAIAKHDGYLDRQGHWTERVTALTTGRVAAQALDNRRDEEDFLDNLGLVHHKLGQAERAIELYQQALTIAQEIGNRQSESLHLVNLGIAYRLLGQRKRAIELYQQALTIAQEIGNRRSESYILGNLGLIYRDLGQGERAIEFTEQALVVAQEIGHRRNEGAWLSNLGLIYRDLGQGERAIELYQQALAIAQEIGSRQSEGINLTNLGDAYQNLGQGERAIELYQQALAIAQEIGDRESESLDLINLGAAYRDLGQRERAIELYQQALAIAQEIGDRQIEGECMFFLGRVYLDLGQRQRAKQYLQQSLTILENIMSHIADSVRKLLIELEG